MSAVALAARRYWSRDMLRGPAYGLDAYAHFERAERRASASLLAAGRRLHAEMGGRGDERARCYLACYALATAAERGEVRP